MKEADFVEGQWEQPSIRAGYSADIYAEYFALFDYVDDEDIADDGRSIQEQIRGMLPFALYSDFENEVRLHCDEEYALVCLIHEIQHWATKYLLEDGAVINVEIGERLANWAEAIPIEKYSRRSLFMLGEKRIHRKRRMSDDGEG